MWRIVAGTIMYAALAVTLIATGVAHTPSAPTVTATPITKVLVFVEENHSLAQMKSGMPYTFDLAQQYGYANNYKATRHPSLPNYVAMVTGQTHGIINDKPPSINAFNGPTVFGQAITHTRTARTYAESMDVHCRLTNLSPYAVKHNPWAYALDERAECGLYDVPFSMFDNDVAAGSLPSVGMVVPNLCNDAHNCSLTTADNWFKAAMTKVFAGPDWNNGNLAVILTADEDDRASGNIVLTAVIHPSLDGKVVGTRLTHYSLCRFLEQVAHSPYLANATSAPDLAGAFGLAVG